MRSLLKIFLTAAGTLLIIVILVLIILSFANIAFNSKVDQEAKYLLSTFKNETEKVITEEDLAGLPPVVEKWLRASQVIGKERIQTVRLKQKAVLRTKPNQPWMSTEAVQYFTVDNPGFIWKAKVKAAPFIHLAGRDKYEQGKGHMLIKLLSLINVADAKGPEIDQGAMLRYLVETIWFPTAALSNYITWEEVDNQSAKATISSGGISASGVFSFNEKGEVVNFIAKRYMEEDGKYSLETWSTPIKEYKEFNGVRIPSKGEIIWKLSSGDFNWFKCEITDIEYNKIDIY